VVVVTVVFDGDVGIKGYQSIRATTNEGSRWLTKVNVNGTRLPCNVMLRD
jgi:hypothetical protein